MQIMIGDRQQDEKTARGFYAVCVRPLWFFEMRHGIG